ncbi:flagellar motor protein [Spectribacter hydrogenoxidans]|uniref:flagellar motor protein n=1 Tax=Spectribacter hydrogenoxidans TaxID=3075608 RepID=UPI0032C2278F
MDKMSFAGLVMAVVAVLGGSILKGSGLGALWSSAAFVIVFVGTFAAVFIQTPFPTFRRAVVILRWVFSPPALAPVETMGRIVEWSNIARKSGLLGLEAEVESQSDPFVRKGLQMLVDGAEPATIRSVLEVELNTREHTEQQAAKVYEGLGIYAPTLGILGAVLGLMAVMQNLSDPDKLGHGIATAFVATIYGIGSANLIFLPIAAKLKGTVNAQSRHREMLIEGLVAIALGENPRNIESRLQGFLEI